MDIVKHLAPEGVTEKFPRVGPGYAELTIRRRQAGEGREDLQLAEWFSGSPIAAGEDDVFDKVVRTGQSQHVRFVQWECIAVYCMHNLYPRQLHGSTVWRISCFHF